MRKAMEGRTMSQEAMQNRQDLLRAGRRAGKDMPTGKYI